MFKYLKQKNKEKYGFTLVETLVAISIFSMSIIALMSVLAQGISDTSYAKYKTTASYLAEEGIEYMRNMRDTYVIYGSTNDNWKAFIVKTANCKLPKGCRFNDSSTSFDFSSLTSMSFDKCDNANCALFYDPTSGSYSYDQSAGSASGFTRTIRVEEVGGGAGGQEIKITSIVSWYKNGIPYNITFSDNLLKWK